MELESVSDTALIDFYFSFFIYFFLFNIRFRYHIGISVQEDKVSPGDQDRKFYI